MRGSEGERGRVGEGEIGRWRDRETERKRDQERGESGLFAHTGPKARECSPFSLRLSISPSLVLAVHNPAGTPRDEDQ